MPSRPLALAVFGATGLAGRTVLELLPDADLDPSELRLFASPRSAGAKVEYDGEELPVAAPSAGGFDGVDLALFCVPPDVARVWAPRAWAAGCVVVDGSAAFRADPEVPLVVPEVNPGALAGYAARGVVALPSGAAAAIAPVLSALAGGPGLIAVSAVLLAPAAGAGAKALEQLEREAVDLMNGREPEAGGVLPHRLAFNAIPQVGAFQADGRTADEAALSAELARVLDLPALRTSATAIRVPVFYGLTVALHVTTARPIAAEEVRAALRAARGLKLLDAPAEQVYPMPMLTVNDEAVLVGRVRADEAGRAVELVLATDDLRRGAAGNAVRVAELLAAVL
jgi:aspartate-semialdehyde dehydrogenase